MGVAVVGGAGRTFVERHHDVGTDGALRIHHIFGRKQMPRSVDVRVKQHAFLFHLACASQRKHLKTAAIGQNGAIPAVEFVQTASLFENLQPRAQIEVIGVAQNNLRLDVVAQFALVHRFHRSTSPHRHKNRRLYRAVVGGDFTRPCRCVCVDMLKRKFHSLS